MKKRITVASAVVAAAAAVTSALLARRAQVFAQAPKRNETFTTSAGPVELPVRYSDGSLMGAFWLVEETKAAALLPDNLEPLPLPGRNAAAGLFMMKADLPAGKRLPFLYSTKDVPPAPPVGFTPTAPAEETPRASYELDPALIQLVGVLCLIGGCLGLVVYAILSIDE